MAELMIAIVIMGILMAGAAPLFSSWMQNSQIRTAAESVQNGLQLARSEAARANASVSFTLSGNDWSVTDADGAIIQGRRGTEGSPNVVITSNNNTVTFNGRGRVIVPTSNTNIDVTNPKAGNCAAVGASSGARCMRVVIETGGKVRMCDPALTLAANPQGC